ncbi:MAG: GNAT family N-acetyltransferase [Actinomycetota bacterium]
MTEVRAPSDEHRDQVGAVMRVSLNLTRSFLETHVPTLPLDRMRCVFDGDRVLGVAGEHRFRQRFGGRELEMFGIWGVATLPEHRGSGVATLAVSRLLHEGHERGDALTALYPAALRPYRQLGYELAGTYAEHDVRLDDLPRGGGPLPVEVYDPARDLDAVRACYRRAIEHHNGPIDCDDPAWWPRRVMGHDAPDELHRAVVARGAGGEVHGYASFVTEKDDSGDLDVSFRLSFNHLVASSLEGWASLLGYLRGFRGLGQALRFSGPPADPLSMLVEEPRVRPSWTYHWMLRLLDVRTALRGRGYPAVDGEALIAVEDGMFPGNQGPWRIAARGGSVEVTEAPGARVTPMPIGTLSAMYSGFLSPFDAVRLGVLDANDPAVPVLAQLFAGPPPYMLDFF